ncbi:hypothetical protein BC940DRAFT_357916 [Gongronella butleri]|nr:hypothetical protein BC940DRAFT_357916 [Gongronella butleri]
MRPTNRVHERPARHIRDAASRHAQQQPRRERLVVKRAVDVARRRPTLRSVLAPETLARWAPTPQQEDGPAEDRHTYTNDQSQQGLNDFFDTISTSAHEKEFTDYMNRHTIHYDGYTPIDIATIDPRWLIYDLAPDIQADGLDEPAPKCSRRQSCEATSGILARHQESHGSGYNYVSQKPPIDQAQQESAFEHEDEAAKKKKKGIDNKYPWLDPSLPQDGIVDVHSSPHAHGACGFRCLTVALNGKGKGKKKAKKGQTNEQKESAHAEVRSQMLTYFTSKEGWYRKMGIFIEQDIVALRAILSATSKDEIANRDNWFTTTDCAQQVAAVTFCIPVEIYNNGHNQLFLPFSNTTFVSFKPVMLHLLYLHGDHFYLVTMKGAYPHPPISPLYIRVCADASIKNQLHRFLPKPSQATTQPASQASAQPSSQPLSQPSQPDIDKKPTLIRISLNRTKIETNTSQ